MAFGDVNIAGMFLISILRFRYDLGFMIRRPQAALAVSDPSLHMGNLDWMWGVLAFILSAKEANTAA